MRRSPRRKQSSPKPSKMRHVATVTDPLAQAFGEYLRNINAGKNHTNAAIFVMRDYGITMNDKHFRRCARRIKDRLAEVKASSPDVRDYQLIEHLVRKRFKEPIGSWEQFDAAFMACGLPVDMLNPAKQYLLAEGYSFGD